MSSKKNYERGHDQMNMSELRNQKKMLERFFVSPDGEIFSTDWLHEELARKICQKNGWKWSGYSAEDFLITEKEYIKYSNYDGPYFRFVAVSDKAGKEVKNNAYFLADMFNLRIEWYK